MLKELFSSNTRVKLLKAFLFSDNEEFFIRELTRKLDEQINSIRRELENLKKIGLLRARVRNRKKYYHINSNFVFLDELRQIFLKATTAESNITKQLASLGDISFMLFSGFFVDNDQSQVDLFIVGEVRKEQLEQYIDEELKDQLRKDNVRYSILSKSEFLNRLKVHDRFIMDLLENEKNIVAINKLKKITEKL